MTIEIEVSSSGRWSAPETSHQRKLGRTLDGQIVPIREHLLLGISHEAVRSFLIDELRVCEQQYEGAYRLHWHSAEQVRARWGYCAHGEPDEWIKDVSPTVLTCHDLGACVRKWLAAQGAHDKSVCEVLRDRGVKGQTMTGCCRRLRPAVSDAQVFVSHTQRESANSLSCALWWVDGGMKGLRPSSYMWVDLFSLRQNMWNEWRPNEVVALIQHIGFTAIHLDHDVTYRMRIWCLFETMATLNSVDNGGAYQARHHIEHSLPASVLNNPCSCLAICCTDKAPGQRRLLREAVTNCVLTACGKRSWRTRRFVKVQSKEAVARNDKDKAILNEYIERHIEPLCTSDSSPIDGGQHAAPHRVLDKMLEDAFATAHQRNLRQATTYAFCCPCSLGCVVFKTCCVVPFCPNLYEALLFCGLEDCLQSQGIL